MSSLLIQYAIYKQLTSNISVKVYDDVPVGAILPYVVIGSDTHIDYSTNSDTGFESTITIHVKSKYNGMAEIKQIQDEIYLALNRAEIEIIGLNLISCVEEYKNSNLNNDDGAIRHGVQNYRLLTLTK